MRLIQRCLHRLNSPVVAFVLVVAVAAFVVLAIGNVQARFQSRVCHVVLAVTSPIVPPNVPADAATLARINARNDQLANERASLLKLLDKGPQC